MCGGSGAPDEPQTPAAPTCTVVAGCDKLATAKGGRACVDHAGMVPAAPTGTCPKCGPVGLDFDDEDNHYCRKCGGAIDAAPTGTARDLALNLLAEIHTFDAEVMRANVDVPWIKSGLAAIERAMAAAPPPPPATPPRDLDREFHDRAQSLRNDVVALVERGGMPMELSALLRRALVDAATSAAPPLAEHGAGEVWHVVEAIRRLNFLADQLDGDEPNAPRIAKNIRIVIDQHLASPAPAVPAPASLCIARDAMRYGSRKCDKPRRTNAPYGSGPNSDLCEEHAKLLAPHQIINGVFYPARDEEN